MCQWTRLFICFATIQLVCCALSDELQKTTEEFLSVEEKLKTLAEIQKNIFGVTTTKEDNAFAQDGNGNISDISSFDPTSKPEQLPYLFEGDIVLTSDQANEILKNAMNQLSKKIPNSKMRKQKRSVTRNLNLRWTSFPIPYYIDLTTGVDEQAILSGVAKWEQETCLTFARSDMFPNNSNALLFISGSGCYSYIGKMGNSPQQVSIGTGCTSLGTVTHEIGHALGLYHEQSRYDRNDYVDIMVQNIQSAYLGQFSRQGLNMMMDYGVGYDYGSVMHYDQSSFNKRGRITIETTDGNYQHTIGQRSQPSFADVKRVNFAYCNASCSIQLNCQNGGYTDPKHCSQCRCPDGLGGILCDQVEVTSDDCGQTNFTATNTFQIVKMAGKKTCRYLVRAPSGMTVYFQLGNLTFVNHNPCTEYLEVKYRSNLVQTGARFCKKYPSNSLTQSETLVFLYNGASPTSGVNIRFMTGPPIGSGNTDYSTTPDDYYGDYYGDQQVAECSPWMPCSAPCGACGQTTRFCNGVLQSIPCNFSPCNNNNCCSPAILHNNVCMVPSTWNYKKPFP